MRKEFLRVSKLACLCAVLVFQTGIAYASNEDPKLDLFEAHPPIHAKPNVTAGPQGLTVAQIRTAYNLPSSGGLGTIAIVDAYDNPNAEKDLNVYSSVMGLPSCTSAGGCFEKHKMASKIRVDAGWALESSLDVQVAHTVAPSAKILLIEAKTPKGSDLLAAVDYACARPDVVAISLSWGGSEFSSEAVSDARFVCSGNVATIFAASGDSGYGASWPSASPNVVSVGGTSLSFNADGSVATEIGWSGSGGGASLYEAMPAYQLGYGLSGGKRITPDVAANADPSSGYSVYNSNGYNGQRGWFVVGGTSGATPLWAAIKALGGSANNTAFYADAVKDLATNYFRDILQGVNGNCGNACTATVGYDGVTGLGSPQTVTY